MPGSPVAIQLAIASPAPPDAAMPAVKPQATKKFSIPSAIPHHGLAIGRDRNWPVDDGADADLVEHRNACRRRPGDLGEAVEVLPEQLLPEIHRQLAEPVHRDGALFPAADRERAGLGLEIEIQVRIAQRRLFVRDERRLLGHQVLVFDHGHRSSMPAISPTWRAHNPAALTAILARDFAP
jgi:hypothetical protein